MRNYGMGIALSPQEALYPELWRGHVASYVPGWGAGILRIEDHGSSGRDVWDGLVGTPLTGRVRSPLGWALNFDGTDDYLWMRGGGISNKLKIDPPFTIMAYMRYLYASPADCPILTTDASTTGAGAVSYGIMFWIDNAGSICLSLGDGTQLALRDCQWYQSVDSISGGATVGNWEHYAVCCHPSLTHGWGGVAGYAWFFLNGRMSPDINSGGVPSVTHNTRYSMLGRHSTTYGNMDLALLQIFRGCKTDSEMRRFAADPLVMFHRRDSVMGNAAGLYEVTLGHTWAMPEPVLVGWS